MGNIIGQSIKRVEDKRFITGKGQYVDDMILPNMTYATILRSEYAYAKINSIDISAAENHPGVVAVFTGQHIADAGIGGVPCGWQVDFKNGDTMKEPLHPLLALDRVRYTGDSVAIVIAEDMATAKDAAELLVVDYEELTPVVNGVKALEDGAPLVHDDIPKNTCFDWELGDEAATDEALSKADHITVLEFNNQRLIPNAIEPRSAIGQYDSAGDKYALYTSTQNPHLIRLLMCAYVLGIPEHRVRVVSPDVGGGFGSKIFHYIEEALVTWCSKQINRPVKMDGRKK